MSKPDRDSKTRRKYRAKLRQRDGNRCWICGGVMKFGHPPGQTDPQAATLEHVVPRSAGGKTCMGNLRLTHGACNMRRGAAFTKT